MTVFRVRCLTVVSGMFLSATVLSAAPIPGAVSNGDQVAQAGPLRLVPRERREPAPETLNRQSDPLPGAPSSSPRRAIQDIEVNTLDGLDPDEAGTLFTDNGGLGAAVWDGMPRGLVEQLVQRIPVTIQSPTMRDILRRLLLTAAALPPAEGDSAGRLIAIRAERLQAMGLLGSAADLIAIAPNRTTDAMLQQLSAENALIRGDIGGACVESRRQGQRLEELFWQQLLIYCQAVQGDTRGAALGANLLAETGQMNDPLFVSLIDRLVSGNAVTVDSLPGPTPILLSLMRTTNVPVPADAVDQAIPSVLGMIAASPRTPSEVRLAAAERGALYGAITADRLAEAYASIEFSKEDLDNALSIADVTRSPRGRALLYQAALVHSVPTARAAVLQKALNVAHEDGWYALMVRVYETLLTALEPSGELSWFSVDAGRALYSLDRADLARRWLDALRGATSRDPGAADSADAMWVIASLAEMTTEGSSAPDASTPVESRNQVGRIPRRVESVPVSALPVQGAAQSVRPASTGALPHIGTDTAAADAWRAALREREPKTAVRRIADAYMLLTAAGVVVGDAEWRALLGDSGARMSVTPDPAYRAMLARASVHGRRGETVLLAALMLGESGPAEMDITVLAEIVSALRSVGLAAEARRIALEIAVQAGI
ncbi:MAG: hypothetical protein WD767_00620 [Alphaproteobacteria bacterium]